jgi:hypothetical protein
MEQVYAFVGLRKDDSSTVVLMVDKDRNIIGRLRPYHEVCKHSLGFDWGYFGSGPAQLALALCCEVLGVGVGSTPALYQRFKSEIVYDLAYETWELLACDVRLFFRCYRKREAEGILA